MNHLESRVEVNVPTLNGRIGQAEVPPPPPRSTCRMVGADPVFREESQRWDYLLTAKQVAVILGVRPKSIYGFGIPSRSIRARCRRWWYSDVIHFIERGSD